ncbi:hypothetical protein GIB67_009168 [Kingdonia uniflora]|uniref:Ubiquitin-like protease family profile domain-containing protein n=1 Tax=Kingdonia uniflora TaxID=39325 RepID=A0A7J7N258_9MAGN|nr:hypothetical protein GIB67_009168 [Kingdonia uniflora]
MFAALPEEKKGALRTTCFAPLLLINPITTMSTLVMEIFNRHLGNMKFQFGETIIQMKPIHVCLILGLGVSPFANEFLFVNSEHMTNFRLRRCSLIKFVKNYTIISPPEQEDKHLGEGWRMTSFKRRQIVTFKKFFANPKLLAISMKLSETDIQQDLVQEAMRNHIKAPVIGVVPVIKPPAVGAPAIGSSSFTTEIGAVVVRVCSQLEEHVGDSTLPLVDIPLLKQYQLSTPEKTTKLKREGGKGEWQKKSNANKKNKKAEEADVPLKKKIEDTKKETFTDEQFDHVPLIQLKTLIPKIPKKVLANRVPRKIQFVYLHASVNQTIDVSAEEQTLEVEKTEDEANQASVDQTTVISVEEQTIEITQTEVVIFHQEEDVGEASQSKENKEEVEHNKEEVIEGKDNGDGNSQNKPDPGQNINDNHWVFCVASFKARKICIYDSMVDVKIVNAQKKKKISLGYQLIKDQISMILPKILIWRDFVDRSSPSTGSKVKDYGLNSKLTTHFRKYPIQPNGYDCGVYMLAFMDNILRGMKFLDLIYGKECRYTIAYDILKLRVEPEKI